MQSSPQLTLDDRRSIRHRSFAMTLLYGLFLISFLALAMLASALTPAGETAAEETAGPSTPHFNALRASD